MEPPFEPHASTEKTPKEFSLKAIILGILLGLLFAVGNAYLSLKVGTTVSASIPAAILSMGILRAFSKRVTILENNIVQTIATVGEGLAAGVIFTIPALILLGDTPSLGRIFILSSLGGVLGILFMIPMRRYLIVKEHGHLPYPEGTACAQILKAGEKIHSVKKALYGFLAGAFYRILSGIFLIFPETFSFAIPFYRKTVFSIDTLPSLLGVGFLIGPRITSLMFAGGAFGWWILIPLIQTFGKGDVTIYPSQIPIPQMDAQSIWSSYIRYIGAGTVAVGGLTGLFRIWPLIFRTIHVGFKELFSGFKTDPTLPRTDRDISMAYLILGVVGSILFLWLFPSMPMNFLTIVLLVILGFFFSGVTSITVGLVGSTSNPVSGMTITTLLVTCMIFVLLGWTERVYLIAAMTMACVANVAICLASTTSQDLKTGFLLGATPKKQQLAEMIGIIVPSIALGITIFLLNDVYTIGSEQMPAPQATLMSLIVKGVISGDLPYALIGVGILLGLFLELIKIPVMPVAIGLYLPLSLSSAMMAGGLLAFIAKKRSLDRSEEGILAASGLIGGDTCTGIVVAALAIAGVIEVGGKALLPGVASLGFFLLLAVFHLKLVAKKEK
jgi:putative OPT family oligopeptide transporter